MEKLNPNYIVGFVDGEGCFAISISKHKTTKLGRDAQLSFEIEIRGDERPLLERLQYTWGCGKIYDLNYKRYGWMPHVKYHMRGLSNFEEVLIPFFRQHPLQGKKRKDFDLFCQAFEVFKAKRHLTSGGVHELEAIRQLM